MDFHRDSLLPKQQCMESLDIKVARTSSNQLQYQSSPSTGNQYPELTTVTVPLLPIGGASQSTIRWTETASKLPTPFIWIDLTFTYQWKRCPPRTGKRGSENRIRACEETESRQIIYSVRYSHWRRRQADCRRDTWRCRIPLTASLKSRATSLN